MIPLSSTPTLAEDSLMHPHFKAVGYVVGVIALAVGCAVLGVIAAPLFG